MAFYLNPKGKILPKAVMAKFFPDIPANTQWIVGTQGDDTFTFTKLYPHVVISLGGKATYNGAATPVEPDAAFYYSYPTKASWGVLKKYLDLPAWEPWKAKAQTFQIGAGMEAKGMGMKKIVLHGGHYSEPAKGFIQPGDKVHIADDNLGADDIFSFSFTGKTKADPDGVGVLRELKSFVIHGEDHDNFISDGQQFKGITHDSGHYQNADGSNAYKATWVEDNPGTGHKAEVWHAIDDFFF